MSDDKIYRAAAEAIKQQYDREQRYPDNPWVIADAVLATVEPLIRDQIAKEIEAVIDTSPWYVRLRYGLLEAVKIIRGGDQR